MSDIKKNEMTKPSRTPTPRASAKRKPTQKTPKSNPPLAAKLSLGKSKKGGRANSHRAWTN